MSYSKSNLVAVVKDLYEEITKFIDVEMDWNCGRDVGENTEEYTFELNPALTVDEPARRWLEQFVEMVNTNWENDESPYHFSLRVKGDYIILTVKASIEVPYYQLTFEDIYSELRDACCEPDSSEDEDEDEDEESK